MLQTCRVSITDLDGINHSLTITASSLFETAATALAAFRQEQWAAAALTPNAVLKVEVQLPSVIHDRPSEGARAVDSAPES